MSATMMTTTISTGTVESSSSSYDHEAAVLEAIHIAHKNRRVSSCSASTMSTMNMSMSARSSTSSSSCLKDSSSRSSSNKKSRRSVSFCDKGHSCQEFDMYEPDLLEEVWFTADEYDEMKQSFEFTIFMMDAGCPEKVEDDDEHTCRGLEKRSEEGQWKRYERKRDYYNAVLDEQDRQWDLQEDDQHAIGQIAVEVTRESFLEAQDQGVLDEIAAYGVLMRPGAVAAAAATTNSDETDSVHTSAITVTTTESDYYGNESSGSWPCSEVEHEEEEL